jgi:hypothetical protein
MAMNQPTKDAQGSTTARARQRPAGIAAPTHWQSSPPPQPSPPKIEAAEDQPGGRNPVRYGDWEYKGLAIDF